MIERKFIQTAMTNLKVKDYLKKELARAQISEVDIQRTPLNTRVIIYCAKPGIIIGRGGRKIEELTEVLEKEFGINKPYIDVRMVENPWLDAAIVARRIAEDLERGKRYRAVVQRYLRRIMEAGAYGAEIRISGKLSGERARSEVFRIGYLKKCGHPSEVNVDKAKDYVVLKPGKIGIKVSIMVTLPEVSLLEKNITGVFKGPQIPQSILLEREEEGEDTEEKEGEEGEVKEEVGEGEKKADEGEKEEKSKEQEKDEIQKEKAEEKARKPEKGRIMGKTHGKDFVDKKGKKAKKQMKRPRKGKK